MLIDDLDELFLVYLLSWLHVMLIGWW